MTLNDKARADIMAALSSAEQSGPLPDAPAVPVIHEPAPFVATQFAGLHVLLPSWVFGHQQAAQVFMQDLTLAACAKGADAKGFLQVSSDGRFWEIAITWPDPMGTLQDQPWVREIAVSIKALCPPARVLVGRVEE